MSSLPSLTEWTQSRLTSIYTATSPETFHAALDAFYSPNIDATVNDEKQTRDNIREKMEASWRFAGNGCEVEWKDCKCQDENEVRLFLFGIIEMETESWMMLCLMLACDALLLEGERGSERFVCGYEAIEAESTSGPYDALHHRELHCTVCNRPNSLYMLVD